MKYRTCVMLIVTLVNYPVCFFRAHLGGQELRSRLQTTG